MTDEPIVETPVEVTPVENTEVTPEVTPTEPVVETVVVPQEQTETSSTAPTE